MQYPDGHIPWKGGEASINSFLLDTMGIAFGAQLVFLLVLGPYADYGNWRPWIMITFQTVLCEFLVYPHVRLLMCSTDNIRQI
jgi:hypothetical protein